MIEPHFEVHPIVPHLSDVNLKARAEEWLRQEMPGLLEGRVRPVRDPTLDASHFCYNISTQASCFDFAPWLINAVMVQRREGAPAPIKIGFVSGPSGAILTFSDQQDVMFQKVLRPLLRLVGAIESETAKHGQHLQILGYGPITAAARRGEDVPRFHSPIALNRQWAQKPVVITLRECVHCPERNSSLKDWLWFAKHLESRGENVLFVRDSMKADEPLQYRTYAPASKDILIRMALYEQAKCLFFVSNGPWNLGLFSHRPYGAFINARDEDACNTPSAWRDNQGVPPGTQFPWAHEQQRVFWQPDTYRNLCTAWEELGLGA